MFHLKILLLLSFFCIQNIAAQAVIPEIKISDIPQGQITRTEYFDGSALYGFIDGGAELYFEYGFNKALVQEIQWHGFPFRIEIYRMKDEEAAFGIFSISQRNQSGSDSITQLYSQTRHQIKIAQGRLYISIVNDSETSEEQQMAKQLAHIILGKVEVEVFHFPKIFKNEIYRPYINNIKYVRGKLGLQNGFPMWEDLFDGIPFSSMYILPFSIQEGSITISQIQFIKEKDKKYFYEKSGVAPIKRKKYSQMIVDGTIKVIKEISPTRIIFMESNIVDEHITPFLKSIEVSK